MFRALRSRVAPTGAGPSAAKPMRHAMWFAGGLVVLWLLVQFAGPGAPPPSSPALYSDEAGTIAMNERRGTDSLFSAGYVVMLVVLVGGGVAALKWAKKKQASDAPAPDQPMQLLGQLPIGPGQQLRLVRFGDDVLLLGVTAGQINLIKAYPHDALEAQGFALDSEAPPASAAFGDVLRQYAGFAHAKPTAA